MRVLQVLARIAADLDVFVRSPHQSATTTTEGKEDPDDRHRRRLAEPDPKPQRLSMQEERAALREELGLLTIT